MVFFLFGLLSFLFLFSLVPLLDVFSLFIYLLSTRAYELRSRNLPERYFVYLSPAAGASVVFIGPLGRACVSSTYLVFNLIIIGTFCTMQILMKWGNIWGLFSTLN
jgi:hypothetical protein